MKGCNCGFCRAMRAGHSVNDTARAALNGLLQAGASLRTGRALVAAWIEHYEALTAK